MTVSYCIPLYNKRRYIAAVLDAALAERAVTGGEVVVYDDASTDGSLELVRAKAVEHSIIVIEAERNRGVFDATTALIGRAGHPYLRLIDADDVIVPGSTGHLVDLLRQHQAVLAHGVIGWQDGSEPPADFAAASITVEARPVRRLLRNIDFNLSAGAITTAAAHSTLPLPSGLRISQDLCVTLRLVRRGRLVRSDATVVRQPRETDNRLSRRLAAMYRDICLIVAEEFSGDMSRRDAAFAVRRQAGRCLRYFQREAPDGLVAADKVFLMRCRLATAIEPLRVHAGQLRRIAGLFERDAARVLT
ncbi:MAG: hypothetical protein QOJ54_2320 [Aliidongia sp.]|jgi:glycosyltransferase involved in cell wall biosynthesis|nr:hypothetical protein [Aliidongia sp.]